MNVITMLYENRDKMPPKTQEQVFQMEIKSNLMCHKYLTELRSVQNIQLPNIRDFFVDKNQRIYTIQNNPYDNAKVYGYLSIFVNDTCQYSTNPVTFIHSIWVDEMYRRSGYASKLVRKMFEHRKGNEFQISVYNSNHDAQSFWNSLGFVNKLSTTYILNWEDSDDDND